jgi:putative inorganic carbon (HCO3(-)) transporter
MATDTPPADVAAGTGLSTGRPVLRPAVLVAVVVAVCAVVVAASAVGRTTTAVVGLVGLVGVAYLVHRRSILAVVVVVSVVRPLLDLTATRRGDGLSPTEVFGVLTLVVLGGWLFTRRHAVVARLAGPLPLALVALVVAYALATLGSPVPVEGAAATMRVATGVAMFLVVDQLLADGRLTVRRLVALLAAVSAVPLAYPLLGLVGVPVTAQKDGVAALASVFFLSNNFAHFLVPLLVVGAAWALRTTGRARWIATAYVAVVAVELVLTQTRGAWIAGAVGVLVVCLLLDRRVAALVSVGLGAVALAVPPVTARILSLVPDPSNPYSESSFAWRLHQWQRLAGEAEANPVTGGGPGVSVLLTGKEAHNDYLKALVETGVFGLLAYLAVLAAAVYTAWAAFRCTRVPDVERDPEAGLAQATYAAAAGYAVAIVVSAAGENLVDNVTFLWIALPLLAVAHHAVRPPPTAPPPRTTPGGEARRAP